MAAEEEEEEGPGVSSGTTATVCVLWRREGAAFATVANTGDSRCVLCRDGKAMDLSKDHSPEDAKEKARVEAAGATVGDDGRVNGGLNLSRAIGDHQYKRNGGLPLEAQMISPEPDLVTVELGPTDSFVVLACDGIWNSMSSDEVIAFVRERLDRGEPAATVCEALLDACMAPDAEGDGSGMDNETVVLLQLAPRQ